MPADPRRALLIINKRAGRASGPVAEALATLMTAGFALIESEAHEAASMAAVMRRHRREVDCVIVGGGDGTLNAAAAGLAETGLTLGILPLGTANDLARTLAIPFDPVAAARIILEGNVRQLDLGEVNGRPFFNVASIGFSAGVAAELSAETKQRWGVLGYGLAAARRLSRMRPFGVALEHDGTVEAGMTVQVAVGNGRYYGGGLTMAEDARPDDGRLDVYSLEVKSWLGLLALAPALRRGTHHRKRKVLAFSTTELTVRTSRPRDVNVDGELITQTPARFSIRPGVIRVFAPPVAPSAPAKVLTATAKEGGTAPR